MARISILPGCFSGAEAAELPPMTGRARAARLLVGLGFLGGAAWLLICGPLGWPAVLLAAIPAWFGVTHLVAAAISYRGCPELGVAPTVLLRRPFATSCTAWLKIDRLIGA